MKKIFILLILVLSTQALAISKLLSNDREGTSYFLKKRKTTRLERFIKKKNIREDLFKENITSIFDAYTPVNACAVDIVKNIQTQIASIDSEKSLLIARHYNLIDDVALNIMLKAAKQKRFRKRFKASQEQFDQIENQQEVLRAFNTFKSKDERKVCLTQNFKALVSDLNGKDAKKPLKRRLLKRYIDFALSSKAIDEDLYKKIEIARRSKMNEWGLSLSDYIKKKIKLRGQYPLPLGQEQNNFVTQKVKKMKMSLRTKLLSQYDFIQIILMGNVIKELQKNIASEKIQIMVFDEEGDLEPRRIIDLEPMERFRFAIRFLKKEMALLATNSFFAGRAPSYMDLIAAAYELGIVASVEVDEVASLEEIWNPKRSFWEKASVWVTAVGSVAAVLVPPPYGFIPSLAVVAIQATTQSKPKPDDSHSLF